MSDFPTVPVSSGDPGASALPYGDGLAGDISTSPPVMAADLCFTGGTLAGNIDADGFRIACQGTLDGGGFVISNDGNDAAGAVAGGVTNAGSLGIGEAGGGPAANGTDNTEAQGGGGAAGQGAAPGTGGAASAPAFSAGSMALGQALYGLLPTGVAINGGGGGGGGDDGAGTGGAGGGGGGVLWVAAPTIRNATLSARGGAADDAGVGSVSGGGGGGGYVLTIGHLADDCLVDVTGGRGGEGRSGYEGSAGWHRHIGTHAIVAPQAPTVTGAAVGGNLEIQIVQNGGNATMVQLQIASDGDQSFATIVDDMTFGRDGFAALSGTPLQGAGTWDVRVRVGHCMPNTAFAWTAWSTPITVTVV